MSYLTGTSTEDVSSEIQAIQQDIQNLSSTGDGYDQAQRQALLNSARQLVAALETPEYVVARIGWEEPTSSAALRILIDLNIFKHLTSGEATPKQASELARLSGADPILVQRLLKRAASSSPLLVEETGPDEYGPNRWTRAFADDVNTGAFTDVYDGWNPACSGIIDFMKKQNYRNPINKDDTIWKFGTSSDLPYFTWLQTQGDDRQRAFANHMKFKSIPQNWYDTVTLSEILPADFDAREVLMVDVGGSSGHDLVGFNRAHPNQPGRLILQDLPGQIEPLDKEALDPIETMCHDFFTPQPVKGAKAYYLKMVLHDWPDAQCREILNHLKPALVPGFSKILINEIVVLDRGADWFSTSVDMLMMIFHSSWERREKQWRELFESVGLKVTRIWPCGGAPEKLIEVELA
ncbi:hypothetical protein Daus18300_013920 [Diaporthe australafricana]|uniref:O-methyltransferase domain-containing protein n=1 Tax=Diaporthe australafricana TaxID=127596 RepID=A0ABR3VXA6_9PEZI